jgi:flagellar motor switch protein FliM
VVADESGLLSQSEIDALLAALAAEGEPGKSTVPDTASAAGEMPERVRRYDFRRPERFSKEQMRALRLIHETWARQISVSLSGTLRTSVEVTLADLDQDAYTTLVNHVPDQGVYLIIGLPPLPGHVLLHLGFDLAMIIVDRMMGGPGTVWKVQRGLSDLEVELLKRLADKLLMELQGAWAATVAVRPRLDEIATTLLAPIALPSDAVIWMTFEVRVKGATTGMVMGLPYAVLKPIASRLSPYAWLANTESGLDAQQAAHRQDVAQALASVTLPISVVLGSTELTVEELTLLQPGDILPLRTLFDALCPVLIGGQPKYLGRVGLQGRKLAVCIEQVYEEPSELRMDVELLPSKEVV